jgi:transketolase
LSPERAIPGLVTIRPADANEVVEAYRYILQLRRKPAVLARSRQALPTIDRTKYASAAGVGKGSYVLADAPGRKPDVILIASGSEVILALQDGIPEIARNQNSKSLELRATTSFARLLVKEGCPAESRVMLADIYNWSLRASTRPTYRTRRRCSTN